MSDFQELAEKILDILESYDILSSGNYDRALAVWIIEQELISGIGRGV